MHLDPDVWILVLGKDGVQSAFKLVEGADEGNICLSVLDILEILKRLGLEKVPFDDGTQLLYRFSLVIDLLLPDYFTSPEYSSTHNLLIILAVLHLLLLQLKYLVEVHSTLDGKLGKF